jgi:hypothetical protein
MTKLNVVLCPMAADTTNAAISTMKPRAAVTSIVSATLLAVTPTAALMLLTVALMKLIAVVHWETETPLVVMKLSTVAELTMPQMNMCAVTATNPIAVLLDCLEALCVLEHAVSTKHCVAMVCAAKKTSHAVMLLTEIPAAILATFVVPETLLSPMTASAVIPLVKNLLAAMVIAHATLDMNAAIPQRQILVAVQE